MLKKYARINFYTKIALFKNNIFSDQHPVMTEILL